MQLDFEAYMTSQNDSLFFLVQCQEAGVITTKYVTHAVSVRPNYEVIHRSREFLLRERLLEEHFVVYNHNRLSEHCRVVLRFAEFASLQGLTRFLG
jgi:hypothetical protein